MKDLKQILLNECYGKALEQRKTWYSPTAKAYQQVRPRYPQALIDRVVELAQLSADSTLLEVGCGPAIATPAFATLGCRMTCIEPNPDFYDLAQQTLSTVYQTYAPALNRSYEDRATQITILDEMGQMAIESGQFQDMVSGQMQVEVTYTVDQYLLLLNTYSPHLKLEPQQKQPLFAELRQVLEQNGNTVQLSYISAFHIARPLRR